MLILILNLVYCVFIRRDAVILALQKLLVSKGWILVLLLIRRNNLLSSVVNFSGTTP